MERIPFNGKFVALVVRGKAGPDHSPGLMRQHADCLLPNGEPIGYFANNGAATGGVSSVSWNLIHMNKVGIVIDHKKMKRLMPYYIDANTARSKRVVSTVLFVEVTAAEAQAFNHYWKHLSQLPSSFHIIGKNCSSHASRAFVKSGILGGGIPGLDTPNNLYNQLAQLKNRKVRSITGYIGHIPGKHSGYLDLVIHKLQ